MTAQVWLQGGGEFTPGCAPMDAELVRGVDGPVVVTALAGTVGRDYATASENGARHLRGVGASEVVVAPDVREDPAGALEALRTARLVVLPGGSPSRLLTALQDTGVAEVLAALLASGGAVMGSSAGAMVLGSWTVLPDRRGHDGVPSVVPGLALVPGVLVVPHWSGPGSRTDWLRALEAHVPAEVHVLGLAEQSGVRVVGRALTVVGQHPAALVREDRTLHPGQGLDLPTPAA